jgi:hypothetical protein
MALAILGALGGIGYSIRKAGADSVRAELQPKLDACAGEIAKQNEALAALAKAQAEEQRAAGVRS